ncbi:MAG TPA: PAS domain S-box protein [Microvirga sp.]|nr:PAS domain S-box protein [Microvirga sp.]
MSNADRSSHTASSADDVLITEELGRRPSRSPDYEAESRALGQLAQEMATNPAGVLQRCAELVRELCRADSAGISALEPGGTILRWHAAAGAFAANLGGTMPREASACGTVLARDSVLLFEEAERCFPALRGVEPRIYESLLAPWHVDGKAVGTLWAIKHTPEGKFDAEDARLLQSLARFASAAFRMTAVFQDTKAGNEELERRVEERTRALQQANDALRANEERFQCVVRATRDIVWDIDLVADRVWWSDAMLRQLGYAPQDIGPDTGWCFAHMHPEDRERVVRGMREAAAGTGETWSDEFRYQRSDGSYACISDRGFIIRDGAGKAVRMIGAMQDVTERRQAEDALRQSEERFRRALQIDTVGVLYFDLDGRITGGNHALARLTGYSVERLNSGELRWDTLTPPEWIPATLRSIEELRSTGSSSPFEKEYVKPDGSRWWGLFAGKMLDATSGVEFVIDITGRKKAEAALRQSEARFRRVFSNNMVPMAVWTKAGDIVDANDALLDLIGYTRAELTAGAIRWIEITPPEYRVRDLAAIAELEAKGFCTPYEKAFRHKDGHVVPILIGGGSFDEHAGTGVLFAVDLTEPKRAEAALRDSQARTKLLLDELQHRVRNTLAVVRSVARRTAANSDGIEDFAMHLDGRISAFARVQAALTRDPSAGLDLEMLIADELLAVGAHEGERVKRIKGPKIRLHPKAAEMLALAIHELATNAVKYGALSSERGWIEAEWTINQAEGDARLVFEWTERGVTLSGQPARRGFGTELIERTLSYDLGGEAALRFEPTGLRCTLVLPLTEVSVRQWQS